MYVFPRDEKRVQNLTLKCRRKQAKNANGAEDVSKLLEHCLTGMLYVGVLRILLAWDSDKWRTSVTGGENVVWADEEVLAESSIHHV